MQRLVLFLAVLFVLVPAAQAQDNTDGSVYSRFGIGQLQTFTSSRALGMGGDGVAATSFNYTNFSNPALWSDQVFTRALFSARLQGVRATDALDSTSTLTSGSLEAIQFSAPLLTRKLGLGLGFRPYSRVNYRVETPRVLTPNDDPTLTVDIPYTIGYEGSGGLQEVVGGLGYRINERVSVGASASFIFGIIKDTRRTSFSTVAYSPAVLNTSTRMWGVTGTLGTLVTFPSLFNDNDRLHVGATVTLPTSLQGERVRTRGETSNLDRDTLATTQRGDLTLPSRFRLGLSYQLENRLTFNVDGLFELWKDFTSDFALPGFNASEQVFNTQDRLRISSGLEWVPAGNDLLDSYLRRVGYRLGFYVDNAYIVPFEGSDLRTTAVTAGLSLPTLLPGTRLDLNLEVGTRGSTDGLLVRDTFYGFSASINIGERWFVKRQLR